MNKRFAFSTENINSRGVILVAACIFLVASLRIIRAAFLPELPNFSPTMALAFCGGIFLPGIAAWIIPLGALFISDLILNGIFGYSFLSFEQAGTWCCLVGMVGLGRWTGSRRLFSLGQFYGMLTSGSLLFYFVTNTVSWFFNPAYPRGWEGLWMSLTVGLPGFPPTWIFFRNSLTSDFLFASFLLLIWIASQVGSTPRNKGIAATSPGSVY